MHIYMHLYNDFIYLFGYCYYFFCFIHLFCASIILLRAPCCGDRGMHKDSNTGQTARPTTVLGHCANFTSFNAALLCIPKPCGRSFLSRVCVARTRLCEVHLCPDAPSKSALLKALREHVGSVGYGQLCGRVLV